MLSYKEFILTEEYELEPHSQMGSNPGGIYFHKRDKTKIYAKFPKTEEQGKVEAATADLYKQMGIETVDPIIKKIHGRSAVVTQWNPNLKPFKSPEEIRNYSKKVGKDKHLALIHHAAIITGNRDVIGLSYDNLMHNVKTGHLVSLDQGGSLHYRAMGEQKPYTKDISDMVEGFQHKGYPAGRVFGDLDPKDLRDAAKDLHKLTDERIDDVMKRHDLSHLSDTVKARRDAVIQHYRPTEE